MDTNEAIAMNATFGTNVSKYPFFLLVVLDDWRIIIHLCDTIFWMGSKDFSFEE